MAELPFSAADIARYICRRGSWGITNLALQKILYVLQMLHLGRTDGEPLFSGEFQAWDYGPVEPSIYRSVRMFGNEPIQDVFIYGGAKFPDDEFTAKYLDQDTDALLKKTPGQLVSITHWDGGAWAKHYRPGVKSILIPREDILEEYRKRADGERPTTD